MPPAADFQRRIDVELVDKPCVLVLESPPDVGAEWVQHEVSYALSHRISVLALTLPRTQPDRRVPAVVDTFRYRLTQERFRADAGAARADEVFTENAPSAVLDEIEARYARQLRRRRTELLGSLADWLDQIGIATEPVAHEWASAAAWPAPQATVFFVTPRAPTPEDLRQPDTLRWNREKSTAAGVEGCLVLDAPVQDEDDQALAAWIVHSRPLATELRARMPELLGVA